MFFNEFINQALDQIQYHPNNYFLDNYVFKKGSHNFIAIATEDKEQDKDMLACLFYKAFVISQVHYLKGDVYLIQSTKELLSEEEKKQVRIIAEKFNRKVIVNITKKKIEWTSDFVCRSRSVEYFGMTGFYKMRNIYEKYFKIECK